MESLDSSAPSQGVEGSSVKVFADDYESQTSKVIIPLSSNCASGFQRKCWVVLVGGSRYVMLARGMVGFHR